MYKICVPASTANFGVGFDCIGMALNLILEVHIKVIDKIAPSNNQAIQEVFWDDPNSDEIDIKYNSIVQSLDKTLEIFGMQNLSYQLHIISSPIPISKGLGSSSASIVAGILCAYAITKTPLNIKNIINLATKFEGHPDNVVPTILGGMQISLTSSDEILTSSVPIPENLGFVALIPPFSTSTKDSRNSLPNFYTKADCIHNLSRFAFMINSICQNENLENLSILFDDKLHQPYRLSMINGAESIIKHAIQLGYYGGFLSGSGSTIMLCYNKERTNLPQKIANYIESNQNIYQNWRTLPISPYKQKISIKKA